MGCVSASISGRECECILNNRSDWSGEAVSYFRLYLRHKQHRRSQHILCENVFVRTARRATPTVVVVAIAIVLIVNCRIGKSNEN